MADRYYSETDVEVLKRLERIEAKFDENMRGLNNTINEIKLAMNVRDEACKGCRNVLEDSIEALKIDVNTLKTEHKVVGAIGGFLGGVVGVFVSWLLKV